MPTLSTFYGIIIKMYWDEHPPPAQPPKPQQEQSEQLKKQKKYRA